MDVAYNRPNTKFVKVNRPTPDDENDVLNVRNVEVGFQGELYDSGEEGFRTLRTDDGLPIKPEHQPSGKGEKRAPTDEEMAQIAEILKGQDINEMFKTE